MNYEEIIHSKAFIDWFGNWKQAYEEAGLNFNHRAWRGVSKVVDQDGKPLISYHGTTHDWTKYSRKLGNHENDMGIGFYATSSFNDAEQNYLSEGTDLIHKIGTYAEHYSSQKEISYERAKEIFEKRLKGDTEKVIEVFLKIKKPLIISISGINGTYFDFSYSIDENENYEDSKDFVRFKEAFDEVFEDFDLSNDINVSVWSEFMENLGELDYTSAYQIIKALKASYTLLDWTYNEKLGGSMQFEIISKIFQKYGFDGVIYLDASEHFKNMNISRGTKHFVAFKPKQIKLADGTNTTFDSKNADIRFDEGGSVGFVVENLPDDYKEIYQIRAYKIIDGSKFYFSRLTYSEDNVFIIELEDGSEIGRATLNEVNNYLTNIRIIDKYRRKGLASSLYDFIEYVVGKKLKPSPDKISNEAKKLWVKRNPDVIFNDGGVAEPTEDIEEKVEQVTDNNNFNSWFGKSKFVNSKGEPTILYHQTDKANLAAIEEYGFNLDIIGARSNDLEMPNGIFVKKTDEDISVGATGADAIQIPVYVRVENPKYFEDRNELVNYLSSDEIYFQRNIAADKYDREMQKKFDDIWKSDKLIKHERGTPEYKKEFDEQNKMLKEVLDEWKSTNKELAALARERSTEIFKSEGYDGIVVRNDAGSFDRNTWSLVVFDPHNIKSAVNNIGTFDITKKGIKYNEGGGVSEINSLYKEHHEVWEISENIIKDLCEENCAIYSNKIADLYESDLKPHFEEEESKFFPSILNNENSKIIEELEDEHEYMEYMIYKIKKYNKASDIKSFCNYIKEHIKKEESLMKTIAPDPYMEVEGAK